MGTGSSPHVIERVEAALSETELPAPYAPPAPEAASATWDIPNLWICDGSVFPTVGGVNPSLPIQAIASRTADRIRTLAGRGEL